jgi:hypothetical protein
VGVIASLVLSWGWQASLVWRVGVVVASGLTVGLLAREYGDDFWETLIRWWTTWR